MEEANSVKVLAFMEISPLSDKFEQIMLTEVQARKMRDALFLILCPAADEKDNQEFVVTTNDEVTITIPNVKDTYTEKDIKADVEVAE